MPPPPPCLALRLYLSEKILKWGFQHRLQSFTGSTLSGFPPTHDIIYIFFWVHKTWISVKLGSHVFCIWIICIWSKDNQSSQSLETTVAPNSKYKIDKNSPVDIMARFFGLSQKSAPTRKVVPALSARLRNSTSQTLCNIRGENQSSWIGHMRKTSTKLQTRPC